jgi:hypothetical protein
MRDSGVPADVLVGKLKKDISFALRQGHDRPSDYTCPRRLRLPSARSSADDEFALNEAGWHR